MLHKFFYKGIIFQLTKVKPQPHCRLPQVMSPFGPQNVLMIEVVPTRAPLLFLICIFGFEYFIENLHFICMFYFSLNLCLEAHNIPWGILPLKLSKSLVGTFIRIIR